LEHRRDWFGRFSRDTRSAICEAVADGRFEDDAGGSHCGNALIEGGSADAAAIAQVDEWLRPVGVGESGGDAVVDGFRCGVGDWVVRRLDMLECKALSRWASSSVTLGMAAAARC
jgi:hypothetical protein